MTNFNYICRRLILVMLFLAVYKFNSISTVRVLNETSWRSESIFIPRRLSAALRIYLNNSNKIENNIQYLNEKLFMRNDTKSIARKNDTKSRIKHDNSAESSLEQLAMLLDNKNIKKVEIIKEPLNIKPTIGVQFFQTSTERLPIDYPYYFNESTKPIAEHRTNFRIFEIGGFCEGKMDGLYDDLDDCENFIICYADRTFRTKCAQGTMWNHLKKECDYPEKVDCERNPSTISTSSTTSTTTTVKSSAFPTVTRRTIQTKSPVLSEDSLGNNLNAAPKTKANVVLISILVPIAIFALIVLVISLWIWNRTFKRQREEFARRKADQGRDSRTLRETPTDSANDGGNCPCACNPIDWRGWQGWHRKKSKALRPYIVHVCGRTGQCVGGVHSERTSRASGGYDELRKSNVSNVIQLQHMEEQLCQVIASNSHATMSSHFEENNWDYNFATRGLYLSQPWVRGQYNEGETAESFQGSIVLTLEPCTDHAESVANGGVGNDKITLDENGGNSDTDGYYA